LSGGRGKGCEKEKIRTSAESKKNRNTRRLPRYQPQMVRLVRYNDKGGGVSETWVGRECQQVEGMGGRLGREKGKMPQDIMLKLINYHKGKNNQGNREKAIKKKKKGKPSVHGEVRILIQGKAVERGENLP